MRIRLKAWASDSWNYRWHPRAIGRQGSSATLVAIECLKFTAVNNRDRNVTQGKLDRRRQQIEESVSRYLSQLDTADRQDPTPELAAEVVRLKEKIARLGQEMERLAGLEEPVKVAPDLQISLPDPDARSMATSGRGSGMAGYNVQVAVRTEPHRIVAHAVTDAGSDRAQFSGMARAGRSAFVAPTSRAHFRDYCFALVPMCLSGRIDVR